MKIMCPHSIPVFLGNAGIGLPHGFLPPQIRGFDVYYKLPIVVGFHVVVCWLNKDGQTMASSENARIVVTDGTNEIWSGSDLTPDSRGVFKITKSNISDLINDADKKLCYFARNQAA